MVKKLDKSVSAAGTRWTQDDIDFVGATMSVSVDMVADKLNRSKKSVSVCRTRIRTGEYTVGSYKPVPVKKVGVTPAAPVSPVVRDTCHECLAGRTAMWFSLGASMISIFALAIASLK